MDNLKYFNFQVLRHSPIFSSKRLQGDSVVEVCRYLFHGGGFTKMLADGIVNYRTFVRRLRNTFL